VKLPARLERGQACRLASYQLQPRRQPVGDQHLFQPSPFVSHDQGDVDPIARLGAVGSK